MLHTLETLRKTIETMDKTIASLEGMIVELNFNNDKINDKLTKIIRIQEQEIVDLVVKNKDFREHIRELLEKLNASN